MTHRIVIVEDQAEIRKLIQVTLSAGDFEVHEADNGEAGLALIREVKPALVLLDVMMPGALNGFQVCQQIKADPALSHIYVLLLTALGEVSDIDTGRDMMADAYMVKPFSPTALLDQVESLLSFIG